MGLGSYILSVQRLIPLSGPDININQHQEGQSSTNPSHAPRPYIEVSKKPSSVSDTPPSASEDEHAPYYLEDSIRISIRTQLTKDDQRSDSRLKSDE